MFIKKIISLALVLATMFSMLLVAIPTEVSAAVAYVPGKYKVNTSEGLYIRKYDSTTSPKVGVLRNGAVITIEEIKGEWGRISSPKAGWVCMRYVKLLSTDANMLYIVTPQIGLIIRQTPSTSGKRLGAYKYGTIVQVLEVKGGWARTDKGWVSTAYLKKVSSGNASNSSKQATATGIPVAFQRTGVVYTVSGERYYQAKTKVDYNGVPKGTVFYVTENDSVVTDQITLKKLVTIQRFNELADGFRITTADRASAAKIYYEIANSKAIRDKVASLAGKGAGICVGIAICGPLGLEEGLVEVIGEVGSYDNYKLLAILGVARYYSNRCYSLAKGVVAKLAKPITSYEDMLAVAQNYAKVGACMAVCEKLIGQDVRGIASSMPLSQAAEFLWSAIVGFSDAVLPDEKYVFITKLMTDGVINIMEISPLCGAEKVFCDKEKALTQWMDRIDGSGEQVIASKLTSGKEWDALVGKTVAQITDKKGKLTKWYGSRNPITKLDLVGQCTWFVWGRFWEVNGVKLDNANNAYRWLRDSKKDKKVVVLYGANNILPKSIAVDTNGKYGHVLFVENVTYNADGSPKDVYFSEANWDSNGRYDVGRDCVLQKLSFRDFVSQKSPDGYIVAK